MFDNLTERLGKTLKGIRGQAKLTEDNIKSTLREVRIALLEADVALSVVKAFINQVRQRAVGTEVSRSLSPGQVFVKIVQQELVSIMGVANEALNLATQPPAVVLLAGLQGAGKTTVAGKLAHFLVKQKKSVMLVSVDIYRPAAIKQLETLATGVGVAFFPSNIDQHPVTIARNAMIHARQQHFDVVIVDTAGRFHIDNEMMSELQTLNAELQPVETLFVVDAMTGQDAANTAQAFNASLSLTGVVLSKTDGDARGGAALSVRHITGKPIKFMGVGEKIEDLEPFHPDRVASRILGMGDVLSLIEEVEQKVDKLKAEKLAGKLKRGKGFDLTDFRDQLQQMKHMGGMAGLMQKLPGMSGMAQTTQSIGAEKNLGQMESIINSMTPRERAFPDTLNGSRKRRIVAGSGTQIQDLNRLLKQHKQMQKMMKKVSVKGGMQKIMRSLQGKLPPGMGGGPGGMGGSGGFPLT
jgi:signal recognition particle subunit SRP54